eukprot:TCALIF_02537-PA protein Name:"Protein of unknown function" AED:0.47 eAED:1.00 QI:0/0/0/1/1/1/2/0/84
MCKIAQVVSDKSSSDDEKIPSQEKLGTLCNSPKDINIAVPNASKDRPIRKKSHGTPPPTRKEIMKAMAENDEDDEEIPEFRTKT